MSMTYGAKSSSSCSSSPLVMINNSSYNKWAIKGNEIAKLLAEKQEAYGDSFGKSGDIIKRLYPNGIPPESLKDALTIIRIIDKLFRIAHIKDAFGESPWDDIVGYALLAAVRDEEDPHGR